MASEIPEPTTDPIPRIVPEAVPASDGPPTADDRTMGLLCHLGGIIGSFLLPLVIWLIKKDTSRFVDDQGKEALNFQITMVIAHVVVGLGICIHLGFLNLAIWVVSIVFSVLGTVAANKGEKYRYPINWRLIK